MPGATSRTGSSPYAFTGREWEASVGLYYYRARYLDASAGRFISEDPIGLEAGPNFYAYVLDNPANWTDPYGLKIQVCQRQAKVAWMAATDGNHAYFWDPRERNHMTPRDCGKNAFRSSAPGSTGADVPDPWTTECYDVDNSDGLEDLIMLCCRADSNKTASTCWGGIQFCLDKYKLQMPPGTHMFGCTGLQCSYWKQRSRKGK